MRHLTSIMRRLGAAICVCIVVGGVVSGCAKKPSDSGPAATPVPSATPYGQSAALARNLANIDEASGSVHGTMKVGSVSRPLTGTVTITGTSSQVMLVAGGSDQTKWDEIVTGGHRYTSQDDQVWVDRGVKEAGTSLSSVLSNADTTVEAGQGTISNIPAHKMVTAADKLDVATGLGLDTWTFDNPTTTLRIWADDAGKLVGFGTTMDWKEQLGGKDVVVSMDLDVAFNTAGAIASSSPVKVAAPTGLWKWIENKPIGIAFAVPPDWESSDLNAKMNGLTYISSTTGQTWICLHQDASGYTALTFAEAAIAGYNDKPDSQRATTVDSEGATWLNIHRTKQKDYAVEVAVVHEKVGFQLVVLGAKGDESATDALAQQILTSVEFTR